MDERLPGENENIITWMEYYCVPLEKENTAFVNKIRSST
jgi:hypothetical protein